MRENFSGEPGSRNVAVSAALRDRVSEGDTCASARLNAEGP